MVEWTGSWPQDHKAQMCTSHYLTKWHKWSLCWIFVYMFRFFFIFTHTHHMNWSERLQYKEGKASTALISQLTLRIQVQASIREAYFSSEGGWSLKYNRYLEKWVKFYVMISMLYRESSVIFCRAADSTSECKTKQFRLPLSVAVSAMRPLNATLCEMSCDHVLVWTVIVWRSVWCGGYKCAMVLSTFDVVLCGCKSLLHYRVTNCPLG